MWLKQVLFVIYLRSKSWLSIWHVWSLSPPTKQNPMQPGHHTDTLSSLLGQVWSLTLAVGSPFSLLTVSHAVQHHLSSSTGCVWAEMRGGKKTNSEWVGDKDLRLSVSISPCCWKIRLFKEIDKTLCFGCFFTCLFWFLSLSNRSSDRLRAAAGFGRMLVLCVSHMHALCFTHTTFPPSQFKP